MTTEGVVPGVRKMDYPGTSGGRAACERYVVFHDDDNIGNAVLSLPHQHRQPIDPGGPADRRRG